MNKEELKILLDNLIIQAEKDTIDEFTTGAIIFNDSGELLLIQRSENDSFLPGIFEIPGGGVEKDESIIDALKREIMKETGFIIKKISNYIGYFDYQSLEGNKKRQFMFIVEDIFSNGAPQLSEEHSHAAWITNKDLDKFYYYSSYEKNYKNRICYTETH